MSSTGDDLASKADVTGAMNKLVEGKSREEAARIVWEYSYVRVVETARAKLRAAPCGDRDEEDIALSVLNTFYAGAAKRAFPDLAHRDNLWRILYKITVRKVNASTAHNRAQKRDSGRVADLDVDQVADPEPTPALAAQLLDERAAFIGCLRDEMLRQIAELRLDGFSSSEIAKKLGVTERTIQRKLDLIRKAWHRELPHEL